MSKKSCTKFNIALDLGVFFTLCHYVKHLIRLEDLPTFFSAFCGSGPGSPDSPDSVMSASSGLVPESSCTTVDEEDPPSELDGGLKKLVIGFCQAGVSLGQYGFPPEYFFSKKTIVLCCQDFMVGV